MEKKGWHFILIIQAEFRAKDHLQISENIVNEIRILKENLQIIPLNNDLRIDLAYIPLWPNGYSGDTLGLPLNQKVYFYHIEKDSDIRNKFSIISEKILPKDLEQEVFWASELKRNFAIDPEKRVCINIIGHSIGYGIFPVSKAISSEIVITFNSLLEREKFSPEIIGNFPELRNRIEGMRDIALTRGLSYLAILRMEELSKALITVFGEVGVDILLVHSCRMNNIYNLYSIRDCCKIFVSPQTDIGIPGQNYAHIFKLIKNNPEISEIELSSEIVHSFSSAEGIRAMHLQSISDVGLFSITPKSSIGIINDLFHIITYLNSLIVSDNTNSVKEKIKTVRKSIRQIGGGNYYHIDLLDWANRIAKAFFNENELINHVDKLSISIKSAILSSFKGPLINEYISASSRFDEFEFPPYGVSIFYPLKSESDDLILNEFVRINPVPFVIQFPWWVEFYKSNQP